jgi:CBS domain-containing protein
MKISEVMTRGAAVVSPESSLAEAAALMRDHDIGAVPVVDEKMRVAGILTDRDIVTRAVAMNQPGAPVERIMTKVVWCVGPDEDAAVAAEIMSRERIRRLPVVRNGELLGIVSIGDLAAKTKLKKSALAALSELSEHMDGNALH